MSRGHQSGKDGIHRRRDRPISVWKEKDSIEGNEVSALVIILDGPGCTWSKNVGCTMCGYNNDVSEGHIENDDLMEQVKIALDRYDGEPYVKIFTSGSFLDPSEISTTVQKDTIGSITDLSDIDRILVESRPEFMTEDLMTPLTKGDHALEIAVGLETSSDMIRSKFIRKGFIWDQYVKSSKKAIELGCLLKTYLLMKPPFIGENDAINDMISSISDVHSNFPGSRISVNPMNIQSNTVVENLYKRGLYRPPWLWSLVKVLKEGSSIANGKTHLMSSPSGGGKKRGVHNCGECDAKVLESIQEFSIRNNISILPIIEGCCSKEWNEYVSSSSISIL